MKLVFKLTAALLLLLSAQSQALAQGATEALNSTLLKLFGKQDNFIVDSEFQLLNDNGAMAITMNLSIAVSEGKMRAEADMSTATGPSIDAQYLLATKQAGIDRVTSIIRQDKGRIYAIYPARRSYQDAALPAILSVPSAKIKTDKTPLGKEKIDGHLCVKNKVLLTDEKGGKQELTTWEAADMKDFPLMVKLADTSGSWVIHNRNVRFAKADAAQFEVPAGYTKMAQPAQPAPSATPAQPVKK